MLLHAHVHSIHADSWHLYMCRLHCNKQSTEVNNIHSLPSGPCTGGGGGGGGAIAPVYPFAPPGPGYGPAVMSSIIVMLLKGGRGCKMPVLLSSTIQIAFLLHVVWVKAQACHWNFGPEKFGPGRKFSLKILVRPDR